MKSEQIVSIVRYVLTFVGGILVSKGWITEELWLPLLGGLLGLVPVIWSFIEKVGMTPVETATLTPTQKAMQ